MLDMAFNETLVKLRPNMVAYAEVLNGATGQIPSTIGNEFGDIYEM